MTAAALASLRVVQRQLELPGNDRLANRIALALRDGTAWMAAHAADTLHDRGRTRQRSGGEWRFYQVSMVEAAGSALRTDRFGDTFWYATGARILCDTRSDDGPWRVKRVGREEIDTAHALMFLARATLPPSPTDPGGPAEETPSADRPRDDDDGDQ